MNLIICFFYRFEKLLFNIGMCGSGDGDFNFLCSVIIICDGDVVVVDIMNYCVQIFNLFGVFLIKFGKKGIGKFQFNELFDVVEILNGDLVVVDK